MALRESANCGEVAKSGSASAVCMCIGTDWEDWWDLFTVAVNAKYSLSVNALLRIATEQAPRILALIINLNEQTAERKVISVLFLSLGTAGRKCVTDKFQEMRVATVTLKKLRTNSTKHLASRETEHWKDSSSFRENKKKKTLRNFWHTLTGLAAKCQFGDQTESLVSLVMNTFMQNMNKNTVQERLCTEPKNDPQDAFRFAGAYEEG